MSSGKRAFVVTGASNGIGRATAKRLDADGYSVINIDLNPPADATNDDPIAYVACDLADQDATRAALAAIVRAYTVVGLVNNAGFAQTATLEDTTPDLMEQTWRVNVLAPMICAQALLPTMKAEGFGRIVNICSRAALGRELRTAYAGTKGNLLTMTKTWALELGQQGITVNAIGPGPIATELYNRMNPPDSPRTKAIAAANPVGRIGTPDDIANAVAFYADPRSGFVNG
ncbi:MAG: SDR family oxidoreductase, partial [Pseudomonadota bacterium]